MEKITHEEDIKLKSTSWELWVMTSYSSECKFPPSNHMVMMFHRTYTHTDFTSLCIVNFLIFSSQSHLTDSLESKRQVKYRNKVYCEWAIMLFRESSWKCDWCEKKDLIKKIFAMGGPKKNLSSLILFDELKNM